MNISVKYDINDNLFMLADRSWVGLFYSLVEVELMFNDNMIRNTGTDFILQSPLHYDGLTKA